MTAGGSAAARAAQLRAGDKPVLWRRILAVLGFRAVRGVDPAAEALARRSEIGGQWEAYTAQMLAVLESRGWKVLHDRALPGSRANLDHVLISPCGTAAVVLDTKRWHAQKPTWLVRGRVCCGTEDRHAQVEAVASYARRVAAALGLPDGAVWPLIVVHGSPVQGGFLKARADKFPGPVWVLGPAHLVPTLAQGPKGRDPRRAGELAARAARVLPPYQQ